MATLWKYMAIGSVALSVAGCGLNQEAGAFIDEGGFGNATMNNLLAQKCAGRSKGYVVPDPVVVLDPNSEPSKPAYYRGSVQCSGELNGKYAQVIFEEYVNSAVPAPLGNETLEIETE